MHYIRTLDSRDIELGRQVTDALKQANLPVQSSLWYQRPDSDDWSLVFATSLVDAQGPQAAYSKFYRAIRRLHLENELPLWKVAVVSPTEPFITKLRSALKPRGWYNTRVARTMVHDQFIQDAYIYYL